MLRGMFSILAMGPRGFISSFRVFVSFLFMAPMRGAKIRYEMK